MGPGPRSIWALVNPSKLSRAYLGSTFPFSCFQDRTIHVMTELVRGDTHFATNNRPLGKMQVFTEYPCLIFISR